MESRLLVVVICLLLVLSVMQIDARTVQQRGLRDVAGLLDDDTATELFEAFGRRRRRDVSKYLCGTELISPVLVVCNGCLLNKTETEAKKLFKEVSLLCCHGKCSEDVLKTLCCE